jgi:alpha-tubulin suppressor-like RCC1 family protein
LGLGNSTSYSSPKQVGALTTWSKISVGDKFGLAIKTDGTLWSWGNNANNAEGCLGLGNTTDRSSPNQVGGDNTWSSIDAGTGHVLGISTYGLYAWGRGQSGRLGLGDITSRLNPTQISGPTWSKISAGDAHSLAIKADGTVWAWGSNEFGRLGLGNTTYKSSPTQIGALTTWSSIAAGTHNSLAIPG